MQTFKDASDREWSFSVNVGSIEHVLNVLNVDLLEYGMQDEEEDPTKTLQFQVRADPILLCKIVFQLVAATADASGADVEPYTSFAGAMHGDYLWATIQKLETEIVNFTLSPELRAAKRVAIERMAGLIDKTHRVVRQKVEQTAADPRIDEMHDRELASLVAQSGQRLESLVSPPAPSHSES